MKRTYTITLFPLILGLVLVLLSYDPASAQWRTQKTPTADQDTDLMVPPIKGPADAAVEMAVFSCFQ
jgi:hypothetical protein